jgi:hypothetical protein
MAHGKIVFGLDENTGNVSISWNDNYCVQSPRCSFCQLTDQLKFTLRKMKARFEIEYFTTTTF